MIKKIVIYFFFTFVSINVSSHPFTPCDESTGMADIYPCEKIDLLQRVHVDQMGGTTGDSGSDIWGWTDPLTGKEYALVAMSYATTFVDITDPKNPIYLGKLDTATSTSIWRDVKTYANYAFIVSEASGHGMQIFDLTKLRNVPAPPVDFTADLRYTDFGNAHNIVINESTGFAYAVGTNTCGAGLHMVNIQDPTNPINSGCFSSDGYTHDAQCVSYVGPDTQHVGKEICFNSNEDTITIVDVSNKNTPIQISRTGYANSQYTHQGWLTEDQRYFLMNDELDEQRNGHNTKTYIWDMLDLEAPQLIGFYLGPKASIDHNLYIKGHYAYLTNYTSGLSIVDITDIGNANLQEVANFDGYPASDSATFNGAWSNYPYFDSGTVIMSDFDGGLFVLGPNLCPTTTSTQQLNTVSNGDNTIDISWPDDLAAGETYNVFRSEGGCSVDNFTQIASGLSTSMYSDNSASGQVAVGYKISKVSADGSCETERSTCSETTTTGQCTAAPLFSGISSVNTSRTLICGNDIQWNNANGLCSSTISYNVYKSLDPAFIPSANNKVASDVMGNSWHDDALEYEDEYYYVVRATDTSNLAEDNNVVKLSDVTLGVLNNGTWSDGAEVGDTGFSGTTKHLGWELDSTNSHSGNRSHWSQNQSNTCNDLTSQSIALTAGKTSVLSFWTTYNIENQYDGGVVEITTDGNVWNPTALNYPGTFNNSSNACGYSQGTPSFTNTNLTWQQHSLDLSAYQGQNINIRWNYSSDGGVNNGGWFLDDIAITNTQIPSQCFNNIETIFFSSFEN